MKLLKNKINCPYACVDCQNWKCEECEIFKDQKKKGNKLLKIETKSVTTKTTAGEQNGTGADETLNKLVDYFLKELDELKTENKKLIEKIQKYKNTKEELNKEYVEKYGIYPGIDEE